MVSKVSTVEKIRKAWALRLNQRIEECRALVALLRHEVGIPAGALSAHLALAPGRDSREVLDVMLLVASLYRADGRLPASREALATAERYAFAHGISTFQLPFQAGHTAALQSDWFGALELFLSASDLASDEIEKSYALANVVNCQECLGLDFARSLDELRALLKKNPRAAELDGVRSQVEAMELRIAFRRGEIARVLASGLELKGKKPTTEGIVGQGVYHRLWVAALPFHQAPYPTKAADEGEFFGSSPRFLSKAYRVRTLQGILHPEDLKAPRPLEFSERLYLWVWSWLADPSKFPLDRVSALIREVDWQELATGMTAEDSQLMRNALLWLSLFDPSSSTRVERILQSIRMPRVEDFAHYRYEQLVVSHLIALRDGRASEARDFLAALNDTPVSKEILLPSLVFVGKGQGKGPGPLRGLRERLDALCARTAAKSNATLRIDLASSKIESKLAKRPVLSQAMALAFETLQRQGSCACEEFLEHVFGISRYDSAIHAPKIANLLARMRQLAPETLKLTMKDGRVHAVGSWESIELVRGPGVSLPIRADSGREVRAGARASRQKTEWLHELKARAEITREDLESLTGKSRASVNRLLVELVSQGVLRREGRARNTIYKVARK